MTRTILQSTLEDEEEYDLFDGDDGTGDIVQGPRDPETSTNTPEDIQMTDHFPAPLAGAGKVSRINTILQNTPKDIRMTDHVPALLAHTITVRED